MIFTIFGPFIIALLIASFSIPVIIKVADIKHLMDEPDGGRKLHSHRTPTLGGIAIFAGTLFAYSAFVDYLKVEEIKFLIPAMILLFFAGVKDDILALTPVKKLLVQMVCAALLTFLGGHRLTSLWGMFGINEVHYITGIAISFFIIVALINAYNLIDGVNGLAGTLGVIASVFFGVWFELSGFHSHAILSFALAGSLVGFLYFNLFTARIFMGDTGSMIVGFTISVLAIKFVEGNRIPGIEASTYYIKAAPAIALAPVLLPLFDMTRVFFQRIIKGRSPFSADRCHIHHILLDAGLSHLQTTVLLCAVSIGVLILSLCLKNLRSLEVTIITSTLLLIGTMYGTQARKKIMFKKQHAKQHN